ncbi:serine hydrolase domain-containing protein [Zobellia uliginosa]|uniref:serine hydrolase domain-containing protein n=1 Tax=Zobellia uliginosa TaxID=143224 RepID=UPI001C074D57|nr:serine hydrolase [Zobellia uliginosa]MBU2945557.1 beta-lactamase family protein [Zobellia uliginosa]
MKNIAIFILLVLFASPLCYAQESYLYSQPEVLGDGWKTINLKSQEVDTTLIYKLFNQIKTRKNKIHSVLLIKNNELIIEEYFKGYSVNEPHDLRSSTKSIRSILMGIAIDKGFIESIDDPISKYLKAPIPQKNLDLKKKRITIKNLLTMSSGLDCNDWDKKSEGQEDKIYRQKDWLQYAIDLPMVYEPGTVSNYCSIGTVMVAEIISQASGMTIDEFADKYLFVPLKITNKRWGHTSKKEVIPSAKRLYMTPRDMAKIGQLILNNGAWNGKQIISEKWVTESTTTKTQLSGNDYAYLWWNIPFKLGERLTTSKTASGNGGQYIIILPEMDLVAVFTGGAYNSKDANLAFAIMNDIFIPTFVNGHEKE